jgi:glycosyltransferase involved in cell wall biosynthesis
MKVLHVIPSVALVRGGPSHAVLAMVKALRSRGIDAEIATTNDNGPHLLDVLLHQQLEYAQVPVQFFPRFSPPVTAVREFAVSWSLTDWLWQTVSVYDLLHVHAVFSYPSTVAMAIARLQHCPYLVRPLGQLCEWSLQQSALKKQLYLQLIERANINQSAGLHLTSVQEQQEVDRLGLRASNFVVPHGVLMPASVVDARQRLRQWLKVDAGEPIVLFLSRVHPKKGLNYLIPALGMLRHHPFTFVIAGNGTSDYEAEVRSLLATHALQDRTHLVGFVEGDRKDLLLQGSDVFALTSHSENFGIAVLEALAAGLPVLITPGVALADIVQEHQLGYISPLSVAEIAKTLEQALTHFSEHRLIGDRARQFIMQNYAWDKIADQLAEVYNAVLHTKAN